MIATAVIDEIGVTTKWARDQIVKQAEHELRNTATNGQDITMDDIREGMIRMWRTYRECGRQNRLKPATSNFSAEKFFGEGLWRDSKLWGFKKGMTANGINL